MLTILDALTKRDHTTDGDFWREQTFVEIPEVPHPQSYLDLVAESENCLRGKRIAVPKMFIGEHDPAAKPTVVSQDVIDVWKQARQDLEGLGATVVATEFPLVSNYEDDSISGQANNVVGFKPDWNGKERGELVSYLWDGFLKSTGDPKFARGLAAADGSQMFPRPEGYIPDRYMEVKNFIDYPGIVELCKHRNGKSIWEINGIKEALPALEAQRKRDFEDWLDQNNLDLVVFPANGDVGKADLEYSDESAKQALQNGVKYSNGNRAIRHMGVPTVSVTSKQTKGPYHTNARDIC
jgi:Asp-tRNA(Asn)/Glu-tRNA(Gln) amidotransferase A subunit family amidase